MRIITASVLLAIGITQPAWAQTNAPGDTPPTGTTAPAPAPPPSTSPAPTPAPGASTTAPSPGAAQPPAVATPAPPPTPTRQMTVAALKDKDLVGANSGELVDIDSVVESNADKKRFLVIGRGGFLGLFETDVAIPVENVAVRGDQVVAQNLTEDQLKALPKFENDNNAYRVLDDSQSLALTELR
jgi:hypothetical protein